MIKVFFHFNNNMKYKINNIEESIIEDMNLFLIENNYDENDKKLKLAKKGYCIIKKENNNYILSSIFLQNELNYNKTIKI